MPPVRLWLVAVLIAFASGCAAPGADPGAPPTSPSRDATGVATRECELDAVETFAQVPDPGRPLGVAVHEGITYVATGANFHNLPKDGSNAQRIFAFGSDGKLIGDLAVPMVPGATMGLSDLAVDSSDRLYIVDMMGRVLRSSLDPTSAQMGEPETYATIPTRGSGSMPAQMAFDAEGDAYVTDDFGRVWKIPPGGSASVWFESTRLQGPVPVGPSSFGVFGARFGPDGMLYLSVSISGQPESLRAGIVYRIPPGEPPAEGDLVEVARFAPDAPPGKPLPFTSAVGFGASGRLYVSKSQANEIAVITNDGTTQRTITSPLLNEPYGLAFLGDELLVANAGGKSILRVCVQEAGLPLNVPTGIP